MIKRKFTKTVECTAIQFDPNDPEWHHSIQRNTVNGKIPDFESYTCIIPCDHSLTIRPGDWVIVDEMNNATAVLYKDLIDDKNWKMVSQNPPVVQG